MVQYMLKIIMWHMQLVVFGNSPVIVLLLSEVEPKLNLAWQRICWPSKRTLLLLMQTFLYCDILFDLPRSAETLADAPASRQLITY